MSNISYTICSCFYIVLLLFVYFFKKKIPSIENKIYSLIIITTLLGTIFEIGSYVILGLGVSPESIWYLFSIKLILLYFLAWIILFVTYVIVISMKGKKWYSEKNILFINKIVFIVLAVVIIFFPLYHYEENGLFIPQGLGVWLIYVISTICIILMFFCISFNFKDIGEKKYYPIFGFLIFGFVIMVIQNINPGMFLLTPTEAFITFLGIFQK